MPAYEKWGWDRSEPAVRGNLTTAVTRSGIRLPVRREVSSLVIGMVNEIENNLGRPIRQGSNWGFCYRNIRGGSTLSAHAYGLAIDLEADANPMTKNKGAAHTMPGSSGDIAARYGFEWGGNWRSTVDFMHFQWKAGSPAEANNRVADMGGTPGPVPAAAPGGGGDLVKLAQAMDSCAAGVQKQGQTNDCTKLAQVILAGKFGYRIAADGDFGPATHNAVVAFQQSKGLSADGVIGKNTVGGAPQLSSHLGRAGGSPCEPSTPSKMSRPPNRPAGSATSTTGSSTSSYSVRSALDMVACIS